MDALVEDLRRIVHDQRNFVARALHRLSKKTGFSVEIMVVYASAFIAIYLAQGEYAQMLANLILTLVPFLLTYVFVEECPSLELLVFHWTCFGFSVILDSMISNAYTGYYLLKVLLFVFLYLKPFCWARTTIDKLKLLRNDVHAARNFIRNFTKQSDVSTKLSLCTAMLIRKPQSKSPQVGRAMSESLLANSSVYAPEDVMAKDVRHTLTPVSSNMNLEASKMEMPVNFLDLIFSPEKNLVFQGPFHVTISNLMEVENKSKSHIAFAIKGNANSRIYCVPPFGIIKPNSKQSVVISVKSFDVENEDVSRDRIAFDYAICPPETQKFSHRLFTGNEQRHRKNIFIKYNP